MRSSSTCSWRRLVIGGAFVAGVLTGCPASMTTGDAGDAVLPDSADVASEPAIDVAGDAPQDAADTMVTDVPRDAVDVAPMDVRSDAPTDTPGDAPSGDGGIMIPDPGTMPATFMSWIVPRGTDVGSPDRAHRVGLVSGPPAYVEATTSTTGGNAFFVFRTAAALPMFRININPPLNLAAGEFIHIHDGAGGVFGPEIPATMSTANYSIWPLLADHVYVFEVHLSGARLF